MVLVLVFNLIVTAASIFSAYGESDLILSSPEDSYLTGVQGFGIEIQCVINSCLQNKSRIRWYKDDILIAKGVHSFMSEKKAELQHFITFHPTLDCSGSICSDNGPHCADGQHCLDNVCCPCKNEEFTLLLKRLAPRDSGAYRCELDDGRSQYVDFELDVHESGMQQEFTQNLTFDHLECCRIEGISHKCLPLCKPSTLVVHKFDPMNCDDEIPNFLHCITDGGNVSHVHCCRLQLVPPFCWDLCSGSLQSLKELHPLCYLWLPEILDCYEHGYSGAPFLLGPVQRVSAESEGAAPAVLPVAARDTRLL